jgi:hypothetical protein
MERLRWGNLADLRQRDRCDRSVVGASTYRCSLTWLSGTGKRVSKPQGRVPPCRSTLRSPRATARVAAISIGSSPRSSEPCPGYFRTPPLSRFQHARPPGRDPLDPSWCMLLAPGASPRGRWSAQLPGQASNCPLAPPQIGFVGTGRPVPSSGPQLGGGANDAPSPWPP